MDSSHGYQMNRSDAFGKPGHLFSCPYSALWAIIICFLIALLVVATVLGNALVMLAFVVDTSLRTQNNFFLLNLAISDFLVGAFCMPLYIPYVLTGKWIFGKTLCKLWLVMDYLLCTSSVFNIVLVSYDRFLSVIRAVAYRAQQRKTLHAVSKMVLVWVLAFLLYGPAIMAWEHIAGHSIVEKEECYAEFYYNWYFLITVSTVEFFTPFISVTFFNVSIYLNIHQRTQSRHALNKETQGGEPKGSSPDPLSELSTQDKELSQSKTMTSVPMGPCLELEGKAETSDLMNPGDLAPKEKGPEKSKGGEFSQRLLSMSKRTRAISQTSAQHFRLLRDKKVAKSLAIIVCTFGVCWAPYTLLMIIRAACNDSCISRYWYEVSFWLLWINSAINPVLYPLCHYSFRKAFMKLLCPKKLKMKASLRST
ncbi:histamine H3 receptor-like [Polyodon spathula]|uniref:histamine H3 receptor-like n=1 Tax=Polyodon spathula TaxID=7913 RepID=UPI001B7E4E74|nr:histamine H3 receptor-like [Polyodon spathula]